MKLSNNIPSGCPMICRLVPFVLLLDMNGNTSLTQPPPGGA